MTDTPTSFRLKMSTSTDAARLLPVEIIFSCQVCLATISEIYRDQDSDKGFRDRPTDQEDPADAPPEKPVTKLWLTECAHLTCAVHLEGGGML